jgi:hypothetical protein
MRHLLSPVIHRSQAAKREYLLNQSDALVALAEANEVIAFALSRASKPDLAAKGEAAANRAKFQRERARQFISKACDLTDYTEALDRAPEPWIDRLAKLAAEAKDRALSPNQIEYVASNPYKAYTCHV